MAKLIVELSDELHARLKQKAAEDRKTLKMIMVSLIGSYLHRPARASAKASTGLCGAWKDPRSAEEIVGELRAARRWRSRPLP